MKKNHIVLVVLAFVLLIGGFFLYQWWQSNRNSNVWTLVPSGTVIALETTDIEKTWTEFKTKSVWESLVTIPEIDKVEQRIESADSITGSKGALQNFLKGKQVVFSIHPVSNTSFNFIFYLPVQTNEDRAFLGKVVAGFEDENKYRKSQRNFQGISITVIKSKKASEAPFSYIIHNNWLVASFNPLLIEDVIRTIDEGNSFAEKNKAAFDLSKGGSETAKIYVDYTYFHKLLSVFAKQDSYGLLQPIQNFATSSTFDVNLSNQDFLLNGFTTSENPKNFLNCFKNQKAQPFQLKRFVPNRTAVFYHYGFDKPKELKESFKNFWSSNGLPAHQHWEKINSKYQIRLDDYYLWMKDEIGLSILESMNPNKPDRLIFVGTNNVSNAAASLDQLVKKVSSIAKDTVYEENYGEYKIQQINISHFPTILLGQMFSGFEQTFYTTVNHYIVFSNTIQGLKSLIMDIEREDTWGKSIKQNLFFEQCQKESNISIYINGPRYYNIFIAHSSTKWKPFFTKNASQIKRFENSAVQFSNVDNKFYTSMVLKHSNLKKSSKRKEIFELVKSSGLQHRAIIRPFVVKNHYDKSNEIFVQDSAKQIYLISKEGQVLWNRPIESAIVGDVVQVDYFKNGKLQLCFATKEKLHIVDRNGVEVGNFPISLPAGTEAHKLAIIDYDNSKEYRFLVSDVEGNLFMFDKKGNSLEGWNPKTGFSKLAAPVRHVRVKNRDYLMIVQQNGQVHMLTRKGESYQKFPVDLGGDLFRPPFMDQGPDEASTKFTTMTESGKLVQFNLAGKVLKEDQWVKPERDSRFQLVPDVFSRNWVIARQDADQITILDSEGNIIFQQETPTNSTLGVQFYNFGGGNEIYAVTDFEQEFTYLYDKEGKLINSTPLESAFEIGLTYSDAAEKFRAYRAFSKSASVVSFR